jgi:hypothetical protein
MKKEMKNKIERIKKGQYRLRLKRKEGKSFLSVNKIITAKQLGSILGFLLSNEPPKR